jgi:hypothetical protein
MTSGILAILLTQSPTPAHAAPRPWKNAEGTKSVLGEFIRRDASQITIDLEKGGEVSIPLDKLHPDDRAWLDTNHPTAGAAPTDKAPVFDQLKFGDDRAQVLEKLKASKFVEMTTDETFLGRSGLNGVFRTRQKIGGLHAMLYFDWSGDNRLKEINLQTDGLPSGELKTQLVPCWKELIGLLTTLHGKPIVADNNLHLSSLQDGSMAPTHLWKLEETGSALLGAARDGEKYQIVVRFTKEEVKPVALP